MPRKPIDPCWGRRDAAEQGTPSPSPPVHRLSGGDATPNRQTSSDYLIIPSTKNCQCTSGTCYTNFLEIGGGFGGTTTRAINGFRSEAGKGYSSYTWTDIHPLFIKTAGQRFGTAESFDFRSLDIGKNPAEQGFENGTYDVILELTILKPDLHAVPDLGKTLEYTKALLKPDGVLFLQEMCPPGRYLDFIVVNAPRPDLTDTCYPLSRPSTPSGGLALRTPAPNGARVSVEEWESRLLKAGFTKHHSLICASRG
ncbi:hypothetical protein S40288_09766 [Stachybotrys chartarum IBT 40288]|nr:hypothetical protein S40288_09766 [Stachybotrys chartarum IBT 40288]